MYFFSMVYNSIHNNYKEFFYKVWRAKKWKKIHGWTDLLQRGNSDSDKDKATFCNVIVK